MLKKISLVFALAFAATMLPPAEVQARRDSPLAQAHKTRAAQNRSLRARQRRAADCLPAAPELDASAAAAPLALLFAMGLMLRSRREGEALGGFAD